MGDGSQLSQLIYIPEPRFPEALDDDSTLFSVFNNSESILTKNFFLEDESIYIEPREFSDPEIWAKENGILNLEGEIIFYEKTITENNPNPPAPIDSRYTFFDDPNISKEEKDKERRVIAFTKLRRGLGSVSPRIHLSGEWVRGYVMAEHHNALRQAIIGIESLIGIDNSTDKRSLDFRLRDLEELSVEQDDFDCPYGIFWYETIEKTNTTEKVQFHISIIGEFDRFEFLPEENATIITNDLNPIYTYSINSSIQATLKVFKGERCCSIVTSSGVIAEPCEFEAALPEIPEILCPEIDTVLPPVIPQDITCICPEITCSISTCPEVTCQQCADIVDSPVTIQIPEIPTEINLNINTDISITAPPMDISVNVSVTWASGDDEDIEGGACFRLIPCGTTGS